MTTKLENKSMVDVAYEIMVKEKKVFKFNELFELVANELGFDDETKNDRISKFYTNISLDGRFVNLPNNTWDLRTNQTFDKVHIDMKDVYSAIEEEHGLKTNEDGEEVKIEGEYDEEDDEEDDLLDDESKEEDFESENFD